MQSIYTTILFIVDSIGQRIRQFAETRYGTLKAFGQAVGLTSSALNAYVQDDRTPGAGLLQRFQSAGMSIDWLLNGEGSMDMSRKRAEEQQRIARRERVAGMTAREVLECAIDLLDQEPKRPPLYRLVRITPEREKPDETSG